MNKSWLRFVQLHLYELIFSLVAGVCLSLNVAGRLPTFWARQWYIQFSTLALFLVIGSIASYLLLFVKVRKYSFKAKMFSIMVASLLCTILWLMDVLPDPAVVINEHHYLTMILNFIPFGMFIFVLCVLCTPLLSRVKPKLNEKQWGNAIGMVGLLIYLGVQLNYHIHIMANRDLPVEPDDAYEYVLKSVEFQTCLMQDCPALRDLDSQVAPLPADAEYGVAFTRFRSYFRLFVIYTPFHALIMAGIQRFGFTWETTYDIQIILGTLLIGIAMSYWLSVVWNRAAAGIAMAWLALHFFPGQGLHYVVPTNWALGFGFLLWALIMTRRKNALWILPIGSLIIVLTHTVGILYGLLGVFIYAVLEFLQDHRMDRGVLISIVFSLLVIVAVGFVLPEIITKPVLKPPFLEPSLEGWTVSKGWNDALARVRDVLSGDIDFFGGGIIVSLLLMIGFISSAAQKNMKPFVTGFALFILLISSLFYMIPRVPAEVFIRIWVAGGSYLVGAMGYALWIIITSLASWLKQRESGDLGFPDRIDSSFIINFSGATLLAGVIIMAILGIRPKIGTYFAVAQIAIDRHNYSYDVSQPKLLLSRDTSCSDVDVLYRSEDLFYFYLVNGALDCGAVYLPAISGTPDEKEWFLENKKIRYLVSQPFYPIIISPQAVLEIHGLPQESSSQLYLFLENPDDVASDITIYSTPSSPIEFTLPPRWSGWKKVVYVQTANTSGLQFRVNEGKVQLKGLKSGDINDDTNWPWNSDIELQYIPEDGKLTTIGFESSGLYPYPSPDLTINVLADNGDTVLAEIIRK